MFQRLIITVAVCLGALAHSAGLSVSPVSVELDAKTHAALINLKNGGGESTRYQLEMMSWSESSSGKMELSPSRDVVFFPQLLTLKPGQDRNVRVGITQSAGVTEKTYRLFIQELPGMKAADGKQQVQVLTRVGIPIFIVPLAHSSKAELTPLSVQGGKVEFGLVNRGNAHTRSTKIVFTAADAEGKPVFQKSWGGWYLLAGGERDYKVEIPPADCKRATSFRAEALGEKLSLSKTVQASPGACGS